jgi:hypothetical protein
MTTAVKTGSFRARVEEAQQEVRMTEQTLAEAHIALSERQALKAEKERALREARIQEATGGHPGQMVADLKHDLEALTEGVEIAEARTVGLQRAVMSKKGELDTAKQHLRRVQLSHAEKLAAKFAETMWQRAHELHQTQLDLISLGRVMQNLGFTSRETGPLLPVQLLYCEISSGLHGKALERGEKPWPYMGDRRTSNELIAGQMAGFRAELEAL